MADKIVKTMTLGEVIQKHPQTANVMASYGLHCIGCHVSVWETVEQGGLTHGLTPQEVDKMVSEMNKAAGLSTSPAKTAKAAKTKPKAKPKVSAKKPVAKQAKAQAKKAGKK